LRRWIKASHNALDAVYRLTLLKQYRRRWEYEFGAGLPVEGYFFGVNLYYPQQLAHLLARVVPSFDRYIVSIKNLPILALQNRMVTNSEKLLNCFFSYI